MRLAYFSPLPPARSGIADYSRELLPHLAQRAALTLYAPDPAAVSADLRAQFEVRAYDQYPGERWAYDLALHQMGNSSHHAAQYALLQRYPGVVVLHDYVLHHFIAHHTVGQGRPAGYARELGYTLGVEGVALAQAVLHGRIPHPLFSEPLNARVVDLSLGLIVHSRYVQQRILARHPDRAVQVIPALIEPLPGRSRRAELGLPADALLFASFGQVTANKRIDLALAALAQISAEIPQAYYLLVGEVHPQVDLASLIQQFGLGERVRHLGFAPDLATFVDWIHTADVVINLRDPTAGETSATALRALAAERPLIVFDQGWYSELPDDAALKLPPNDLPALAQALRALAQDPARRRALGAAGGRYTRARCHPAQVAAAYADFLRARLAALQAS